MAPAVRVLIVDDQHLVRQGIRGLLALSDEVDVVGDCADGDEALAFLAHHSVDVVLLDLRMPGRDGVATLEAMRERDHSAPTLVLTTFDDDELALSALRAGAKGYMLKDVTLQQLLRGIRTVADGGTLLQPSLTERLLRAVARRTRQPTLMPPPQELTSRERDVLRLAANGWSNRQIAHGLHLAEGTVKNHMSSIMLKLRVTDRTKAVLLALELGVLTGRDDDPVRRSSPDDAR